MRVYSLTAGLGVFLASQVAAAQVNLTPTWTRVESGYTTDSIAIGDVHAAPGDEVLVLSEGSTWYDNPPSIGTGKAVVLSQGGIKLSEFLPPPGRDIMGVPLIEQLDVGTSEFLIGEFESAANNGAIYALPGNSTTPVDARWILTPRGWPGLWNMGVSAGNVLTGGGDELIVPSWDGIVQLIRRGDGGVLATYDTWVNHGENIYGHVAIANVTGGGSELVLVGASTGRVIVLKANTDGTMTPTYVSDPNPDGGFAYGSGPAIGDIDGDGDPEVVVAYAGPNPIIRAFDPINGTGGACEYEWSATGGSNYYWGSPVIGDVDGDGFNEVVVQSVDSILSVLSAEGVTSDPILCNEGNYDVQSHLVGSGGQAWFTPVLADLSGDSAPDIVTANYTTLEVLDIDATGAVATAYRAVEPDASFYPSATIVPTGSGAAIFVAGWVNGAIYRYDIAENVPTKRWHTYMADNARNGFCCPDLDCTACGGGACEQECQDGCDFSCETLGCECAFDCVDSDSCKTTCDNGTTCSMDCSGSTNDCDGKCLGASTCEFSCAGAAKCDKFECDDGSTCGLDCTGATGDCKLECDTASVCSVDCTNADKCKDNKCDHGSSCDVECENTEECQLKCDHQSTCTVVCAGGKDCKTLECRHGSTCDFSCVDAEKCELKCEESSDCIFDCTNANDCEKATCKSGATCLLDCTGATQCGWDSCEGSETSCAGDVIACNRPCP